MIAWLLLGLRLVALLLLLLFVALSIYHLRKQRQSLPPRHYLRRLDQPAPPFPLQNPTLIGREADNSLIFEAEFVSAHHAKIIYRNDTWWLTDLNSTNGTTLNDAPLNAPTPLADGDVIAFGNIQLQLTHDEWSV